MVVQEIQEIRVANRGGDSRAQAVEKLLPELGIDGVAVTAQTVYRYQGISVEDAHELATNVLTDPLVQTFSMNGDHSQEEGKSLEIGYKPGVMHPIEESLLISAKLLDVRPSAVSASVEYGFNAPLSQSQLEAIGKRLTSQVETVIWQKPESLFIQGTSRHVEKVPLVGLSANELVSLSEERRLFLTAQEMMVIQKHFASLGRAPTDAEVETLAQTWSEHCNHKTFKARLIEQKPIVQRIKESLILLLKGKLTEAQEAWKEKEKSPLIGRIRKTAERYFEKVEVVSAFSDNAGGIRFYDGQVIMAKGETHNSPVAVEPYGGSMTKNGGVFRDVVGFGLGGENLVALMVNCFGLPNTKSEDVPRNTLHPLHLLLENFRGERDYGNQLGIPTQTTTLHFHPDFGPKPTSMGIVVGIIPEVDSQKGEPKPGDFLVTVGGKTGRDGIHGATFSSGEMTAQTSTIDSTAVQIGNAITEKNAFDALVACRKAGLIRAITDCGAGGYSSAVGEMGEHVGVSVQLNQIPLKYSGLASWEIWLSESQERMVIAVDPRKWAEFKAICDAYETSATVFGQFTGDGQLRVSHGNEMVVDMDMDFLHNGLPQRELPITYESLPENNDVPNEPTDWMGVYQKVLGHLNVASTEEMLRQFDTTVQGRTVLHPFSGVHQDAPNDASVLAPIYRKPYGVVTSHALNPILNRLDPYAGSMWVVAHAATKFTVVGGNIDKAAMVDNFVWPKPNPKFLGDLDKSVDALCDAMDVLQIPCVSGKDSLSSTFDPKDGSPVINIPPVLNITMFGKIPDVEKTISSDIKSTDSTLVLVGKADMEGLGGSVYFQTQGVQNTHQSQVDMGSLRPVLESVRDAIQTGKVKSCKAVGEGGLATTVAQMCFGGDCGARINLGVFGDTRADFALFSETAGTLIVEVSSESDAHELFNEVPHAVIGRTTARKEIEVQQGHRTLFSAELSELKRMWQQPMKEILAS